VFSKKILSYISFAPDEELDHEYLTPANISRELKTEAYTIVTNLRIILMGGHWLWHFLLLLQPTGLHIPVAANSAGSFM
jgi:hypothetical protein